MVTRGGGADGLRAILPAADVTMAAGRRRDGCGGDAQARALAQPLDHRKNYLPYLQSWLR